MFDFQGEEVLRGIPFFFLLTGQLFYEAKSDRDSV